MKMLVDLKNLKPNPFRDFTVDPIDSGVVAELASSIEEYGFWGGVVCRKGKNGDVEIGAGHHRVHAAMKSGIRTADLYIGGFDDESMIRVYATENTTQRGNSSTAIAGSVASAIRFLAKAIMGGSMHGAFPECIRAAAAERGSFGGEKGLGSQAITKFLDGIAGVSPNSVTLQLANLKASGDYSRIVKEVAA